MSYSSFGKRNYLDSRTENLIKIMRCKISLRMAASKAEQMKRNHRCWKKHISEEKSPTSGNVILPAWNWHITNLVVLRKLVCFFLGVRFTVVCDQACEKNMTTRISISFYKCVVRWFHILMQNSGNDFHHRLEFFPDRHKLVGFYAPSLPPLVIQLHLCLLKCALASQSMSSHQICELKLSSTLRPFLLRKLWLNLALIWNTCSYNIPITFSTKSFTAFEVSKMSSLA